MTLNRSARFDPTTFLSKVGDGRTLARYRKNRVIFAQGDAAGAVFYVQSGRVKLTVVSQRGKSAIVGMFAAGDFLGEGCLAGQPLRIATASAITDAALMRIEKAVMVEVLHQEPAPGRDVYDPSLISQRSFRRGPDRSDAQLEREAARSGPLAAG